MELKNRNKPYMSVNVKVLQKYGLLKPAMCTMCMFSGRCYQSAKMTQELLKILRHQGWENCDQERHRDLRSHNPTGQQEV